MKNEIIEIIKSEFNDTVVEVAIDNICKKKELVATMVGYILANDKMKTSNE